MSNSTNEQNDAVHGDKTRDNVYGDKFAGDKFAGDKFVGDKFAGNDINFDNVNSQFANQIGGSAFFGSQVNNIGFSTVEFQETFARAMHEVRSTVEVMFEHVRPVQQHKRPISGNDFALPANAAQYGQHFKQLTLEERLFVLVVFLFPDITWPRLQEIYEQAFQLVLPPSSPGTAAQSSAEVLDRTFDQWACVAHVQRTEIIAEDVLDNSRQKYTTINFFEEAQPIIRAYIADNAWGLLVKLTPLLRELSNHEDVDIRAKAGAAIGIIANIDFDFVQSKVLEPWSQAERPRVRAAVGYALHQIVCDGYNDNKALQLLLDWSSSRSLWTQSWTAAAACKLVGLQRFAAVAPVLTALAHNADDTLSRYAQHFGVAPDELSYKQVREVSQNAFFLLTQLPQAVSFTLLVLATNGKLIEVVELSVEWLKPKENAPLRDGVILLLFLRNLGLSTLHQRSQQATQLSLTNEPVTDTPVDLFALMSSNKRFRQTLGLLLAHLFHVGPEHRQRMFAILQEWIWGLDALQESIDGIENLIFNAFHNSGLNEKRRILDTMRRWERARGLAALNRVGAQLADEFAARL